MNVCGVFKTPIKNLKLTQNGCVSKDKDTLIDFYV